ncbi:translation initiation factor IF-2 [Alligator mississippiensis]|uniref:translation initiation factor IF-2 n=1 Tax=Alligator mississippiensis TaxID=8496 RepID=UPI002878116C|nr:translation initiation factor IF-2 [Alligator mississippiensis]
MAEPAGGAPGPGCPMPPAPLKLTVLEQTPEPALHSTCPVPSSLAAVVVPVRLDVLSFLLKSALAGVHTALRPAGHGGLTPPASGPRPCCCGPCLAPRAWQDGTSTPQDGVRGPHRDGHRWASAHTEGRAWGQALETPEWGPGTTPGGTWGPGSRQAGPSGHSTRGRGPGGRRWASRHAPSDTVPLHAGGAATAPHKVWGTGVPRSPGQAQAVGDGGRKRSHDGHPWGSPTAKMALGGPGEDWEAEYEGAPAPAPGGFPGYLQGLYVDLLAPDSRQGPEAGEAPPELQGTQGSPGS